MMGRQRWTGALVGGLAMIAVACAGDEPAVSVTAEPVAQTSTAPATPAPVADPTEPPPTVAPAMRERIATTTGDASGNRLISGRADLGRAPITVTLEAFGEWVVGAEIDAGVVWVVVDEDGGARAVIESGGAVEPYALDTASLPPGMPPTLVVGTSEVRLFDPQAMLDGVQSAPRVAPLAGHLVVDGIAVVVADDGRVFAGEGQVPGVVALPDTRIVVSNEGLVALMSDPTERLTHGVLGDAIEAETVSVIDPATAEVVVVLDAPDDTVFEAVSPMWGDVDGDGAEEIVATASNAANGARLAVFAADGRLVAQSAPVGLGSRWLNQLAVAPVGPGGEIEVIEVKTPHIGGIVQWYRIDGSTLEREASLSGYSTHAISSRNLDEGLVIDADGDGRLDVVAPSQDNRRLAAVTRTEDGAQIALEVDLGGEIASNVTAVDRADGTATLAVATKDGRLLIWP